MRRGTHIERGKGRTTLMEGISQRGRKRGPAQRGKDYRKENRAVILEKGNEDVSKGDFGKKGSLRGKTSEGGSTH